MLNGRGKGDLIVQVQVHTPGKISKRQRELLQGVGTGSPRLRISPTGARCSEKSRGYVWVGSGPQGLNHQGY